MLKENLSIEDLILCLAGIKPIDAEMDPPQLMSSDYTLIHSLGRQIFKQIGFTDKQYDLAKRKVNDYCSYFSFLPDLEQIKNTTSLPLREIDRSRWIKIERTDKGPRIAIRFTFQKKLISSIEELRRKISDKSDYDKENKTHYFEYSERNLFEVIEAFADKNFELDDLSLEIYQKLKQLRKEDHVPGVYDLIIKNLHPSGVSMLVEELGEPSKDNLLLYKDRAFKYGLDHVDPVVNEDSNSLAFKIAHRKYPSIQINNQTHKLDNMLLALDKLSRYPILVLLPQESCHDSLIELHQYARNLISAKETSVVFRLDNQGEGIHFNNYIKDQMINNKVDVNTKLVYTLDSKIPKPLLSSDWSPEVILVYGTSRIPSTKRVLECYADKDLIIHYNDTLGSGHNFYYRKDIEKI